MGQGKPASYLKGKCPLGSTRRKEKEAERKERKGQKGGEDWEKLFKSAELEKLG